MKINVDINGIGVESEVADNTLLLDWLRDELGLTGAKQSCEVQVCGVCTVLVDGAPVSSCTTLAIEAHNSAVTTIEGLRETDFYHRAEEIFIRHCAVQCGFCTPGFVLTIFSLVNDGHVLNEHELKEALRGSMCRCTGYRSIVDAAFEIVSTEIARNS